MPTATVRRVRAHFATKLPLEIRSDALPDGACGVMNGIALPYGVVDSYRTRFRAGCMDRTIAEKVAAGKVGLFCDHSYGTRDHVGVVKSLSDVAGAAAVFGAPIFDCPAGRELKEYVESARTLGAQVGVSVGFYDRASEWVTDPDGTRVLEYTEIELEEISVTPRPAVPGAQVTGVRTESTIYEPALRGIYAAIGAEPFRALVRAIDVLASASSGALASHTAATADSPNASRDTGNATGTETQAVTMDERIRAVRESYRR